MLELELAPEGIHPGLVLVAHALVGRKDHGLRILEALDLAQVALASRDFPALMMAFFRLFLAQFW